MKELDSSLQSNPIVVIIDNSAIYAKGIEYNMMEFFMKAAKHNNIQFTHFYPLHPPHFSLVSNATFIIMKVKNNTSHSLLDKNLRLLRKAAPAARIILYTSLYNPACAGILSTNRNILGYFLTSEVSADLFTLFDATLIHNQMYLSPAVLREALKKKDLQAMNGKQNNTFLTSQEILFIDMIYKKKHVALILDELGLSVNELKSISKAVVRKIKIFSSFDDSLHGE